MTGESFIVTGWSGNTNQLGFSILKDGIEHFPKGLQEVRLWLPGIDEVIIVDLNDRQDTFWTTCSELANVEIRDWLLDNGYQKNGPKWQPSFMFTKIAEGEFKVSKITK